MKGLLRWLRFNAVGAAGILVQLGVLAGLTTGLGLHYLVATACAVEAAVIHNFLWHQRWTWADRKGGSAAARLLRFNLTTGAVSIFSNLVLMSVLVGWAGLPYLAANLVSIAITSVVNYLLADRLVFTALE